LVRQFSWDHLVAVGNGQGAAWHKIVLGIYDDKGIFWADFVFFSHTVITCTIMKFFMEERVC
jgi:hypothetical protein